MSLIKWDNSYSVGNDTIDEQHKKLFKLVNEFNENSNSLINSESISKLLKGLKEYIIFHFKTEEMYLRLCNFPYFMQHKKEHERFIEKVNDIEHRFVNGYDTKTDEISNFFTSWIKHHIKGSDAKYAAYITDIETD